MEGNFAMSPEFQRRFKWIKKLGNGSFGTVFLFEERSTGEKYACKLASSPRAQTSLMREAGVVRTLQHPNIVKFISDHFGFNERPYCLIMAYHPLGSLEKYSFCTEESLEIIHQCLKALEYLEYKTIFHRDVKEDNILIKSISPLHVCLADFGLAVTMSEGAIQGGQRTHIAIEVYLGRRFSYIADIWSLGVTALYLIHRFPEEEARCFDVSQDRAGEAAYYSKLLSEASLLSGHFGNLVKHMVCAPDTRWTAAECLRHLDKGRDPASHCQRDNSHEFRQWR